jgi:hypothetical protein
VRAAHPDAGGDETLAGERVAALVRARDQLLDEQAGGAGPPPHPAPLAGSSRMEAFVLALARFIARHQGRGAPRRHL